MHAERAVWRAAAAVTLVGAIAGGLPLLVGPPGGDDAYHHAMLAQQHAVCWRGGALLPRWYPDLNGGLGSPEPRTRPVVTLAIGAAAALAVDDAAAATSLVTAVIPPVAGLLMLWAVRRRGGGASAAALAGAAWAAAPYLLVSLHQRVALHEAWALALLPPLFAILLPGGDAGRRAAAGFPLLALLLATQLLVTLMAAIVVVAANAAAAPRRLPRVVAAIAAALALAAYSWLPNVISLWRIQAGSFTSGWFDWRQRFVLTRADPDPQLGGHMLLAFAGIVVAAALLAVAERGVARWLAAGAIATAALATPLSRWVWEAIPGFPLLQFPWRWLGPASVLAVLAVAAARRPWLRALAAAVLVAPALAVPWFDWRLPHGPPWRPSSPAAEAVLAATRYGVPPIVPSFPATLPRGLDLAAALREGAAAHAALPPASPAGPARWGWSIAVAERTTVTLPLLADPGWRAEVDGAPAALASRAGLATLEVPAGSHRVDIRQVALGEEWVGGAISLFAAAGLLLLRRRRPQRPPADPQDLA